MINVNKQSRLYKFYNALSYIFLFELLTPFKRGGEIDTFRDLCTFIRVSLSYLFLSLPLMILFFTSIIYTIVQIYNSAVTVTLNPTVAFIGIISTCIAIIAGIALVIIGFFMLIEKTSEKISETTFSDLIKQAVSSRHDKFCKIIQVVDIPKVEKSEADKALDTFIEKK